MIFEKLEENGIKYAVGVAKSRLKMTDITEKDYFLVVAFVDSERLNEIEFIRDEGRPAHKYTWEKTLSAEEVRWFHDHRVRYDLVNKTTSGQIYELKGSSFSAYLGTKIERKLDF